MASAATAHRQLTTGAMAANDKVADRESESERVKARKRESEKARKSEAAGKQTNLVEGKLANVM